MTVIHGSKETRAQVKLCPKCGGASVTENELSNAVACEGCGWIGVSQDLVVTSFKHQLGSNEAVLHTMVTDLRNMVGKDLAVVLGKFLKKWGFITDNVTPKVLSQYIVAVAKAIMTAIIQVRSELEKEKAG